MDFDLEMQRALEADGEKLRQLTGEDHGPYFLGEDTSFAPCPVCFESCGFYGLAIDAGIPAAKTVDAVNHIERAARNLHRLTDPTRGMAKIDFAYCCGMTPAVCDCVTKNHGFAFVPFEGIPPIMSRAAE